MKVNDVNDLGEKWQANLLCQMHVPKIGASSVHFAPDVRTYERTDVRTYGHAHCVMKLHRSCVKMKKKCSKKQFRKIYKI